MSNTTLGSPKNKKAIAPALGVGENSPKLTAIPSKEPSAFPLWPDFVP